MSAPPSYVAVRAAMIAEGMALGWHQHGDVWVHGLGPGDGCAQCDAIDAKWFPQLYGAPVDDVTAIVLARRKRIAEAAKLGIGPAESTPRKVDPVANQRALGVPTRIIEVVETPVVQAELHLVAPPPAIRTDDDIDDDEPPPPPETSPPAPAPTFVLTNPTAESIRRHRRKR